MASRTGFSSVMVAETSRSAIDGEKLQRVNPSKCIGGQIAPVTDSLDLGLNVSEHGTKANEENTGG